MNTFWCHIFEFIEAIKHLAKSQNTLCHQKLPTIQNKNGKIKKQHISRIVWKEPKGNDLRVEVSMTCARTDFHGAVQSSKKYLVFQIIQKPFDRSSFNSTNHRLKETPRSNPKLCDHLAILVLEHKTFGTVLPRRIFFAQSAEQRGEQGLRYFSLDTALRIRSAPLSTLQIPTTTTRAIVAVLRSGYSRFRYNSSSAKRGDVAGYSWSPRKVVSRLDPRWTETSALRRVSKWPIIQISVCSVRKPDWNRIRVHRLRFNIV